MPERTLIFYYAYVDFSYTVYAEVNIAFKYYRMVNQLFLVAAEQFCLFQFNIMQLFLAIFSFFIPLITMHPNEYDSKSFYKFCESFFSLWNESLTITFATIAVPLSLGHDEQNA